MAFPQRLMRYAATLVVGAALAAGLRADDTDAQLRALTEQNRRLEALVQAQQKQIDELRARMDQVEGSGEPAQAPVASGDHAVRVAAEAGFAFFNTGTEGQFPNAEFRVDDPVISVEAPVWKNTYFYSELKLLTREAINENFQLGELYVDFEDVSAAWGHPGALSIRAGRINTPFGEEYQLRGPVENPLILHSVGDIWGTDQGVEIYGQLGPARYVVAVQNGGLGGLHDYHPDKAVVARLGWDPTGWLHLSGSAMRTGLLTTTGDGLSNVWFANGFFRSIGTPTATSHFWADLFEADARAHWRTGHLALAAGEAWYDDNDATADNQRRIRYGYVEAVQDIADSLYGAVRYSAIRAPRGYPLVGIGAPGEYGSRLSLTEELRRLSVGVGYRFGPPLVLKLEYSLNSGRTVNGASRDGENFFGTEVGLKF